jgi:MtrB/PioB family decaheme-associated outer membrane protein
MLPEPINSNTKQVEAKLNYHTDKLMLSGGYYGSFYTNSNDTLTPTVSGPLNAAASAPLLATMRLPMALPPDNQAHQLYLSGNYRFTPTTRATFKYAYTHGTQNEAFPAVFVAAAPAGRTNLGGVVDTHRYQAGLTARPMPKLSLLANVRYEDKKDKTPIDLYNIEHATTFTNDNISHKRLNAKVEGTYQLPQNYRATLGVDYESMDRGIPVATTEIAGLTALRAKTHETDWRAELRKAMSETFTGAIQYSSARRTGSDYTSLTPPFPSITEAALIAASSSTSLVVPSTMTDRNRDKWKLSANWTPAERVSLQFFVEDGSDSYKPPVPRGTATVRQPGKGLQDTSMRLYSIDGSFVMSDAWKMNAYYSRGEQTVHVNHSTGYMAALKNTNDSFGLGITGQPSGRLKVGADLSYINDKNVYDQALSPGGTPTALLAYGLPDVTFNQIRLKLFGEYAVQKNSYIRLDLVHQRSKLDEWTWGYNGTPYRFSDNTTVTAKETQTVTFAGVSYVYKFK